MKQQQRRRRGRGRNAKAAGYPVGARGQRADGRKLNRKLRKSGNLSRNLADLSDGRERGQRGRRGRHVFICLASFLDGEKGGKGPARLSKDTNRSEDSMTRNAEITIHCDSGLSVCLHFVHIDPSVPRLNQSITLHPKTSFLCLQFILLRSPPSLHLLKRAVDSPCT